MSKPLPNSIDLIKNSWHLFITTWNTSMRISIWFLYFGLVTFLLALIEKYYPSTSQLLLLAPRLVIAVAAYFVSIRLLQIMLQLESDNKPDLSKEASLRAVDLLIPNVLVSILHALIVLGGMVLLILPGIYLAIALSFSQIFVIDRGLRGVQAIKASYNLVKGRWWPTAWRLCATNLVFGLALMLITGLGFAALLALWGPTEASANLSDPLFAGTQALFSSMIQAAILPLFVGLQVKIYRAL